MLYLYIPIVAAILTTTLFAYALAVSYQLAVLFSDGVRARRIPNATSLAALWQNIGLMCVLFGFLQFDLPLIVFGALMIGLRLVTESLRAPPWDNRFEPVLLVLAVISLGLLGTIHYIHRLSIE